MFEVTWGASDIGGNDPLEAALITLDIITNRIFLVFDVEDEHGNHTTVDLSDPSLESRINAIRKRWKQEDKAREKTNHAETE